MEDFRNQSLDGKISSKTANDRKGWQSDNHNLLKRKKGGEGLIEIKCNLLQTKKRNLKKRRGRYD